MLRGKTCTHTHRFKSLALRMPSDVASLLSLWLLSSSFQFFFFLAQTPPLRPCRWAVYLSPPSPVSDLLFMSLHLSLFPALWSRVWVLLGERCATQMMSHPVTLSSPPPPLLPFPHPPALPTLSPHWAFFSLQDKLGSLTRAAGWYEGAYNRCHFILAQASPPDRDVKPPLSQKQQAPHQQTYTSADVSLPCCL